VNDDLIELICPNYLANFFHRDCSGKTGAYPRLHNPWLLQCIPGDNEINHSRIAESWCKTTEGFGQLTAIDEEILYDFVQTRFLKLPDRLQKFTI